MRTGLVALALIAVATSCGGSVPAMRVTRFSALPANQFPAFDRTVADPAAARPLNDAVRALPPAPAGRSCPVSQGLRYRLSFNEAARVVLSVVVEGDGCADVLFTETDRRATDDAFWDLFARTLGVGTTDVYRVRPGSVTP